MCASSSSHVYHAPRRKTLPTVLNFMDGSRPTPTNSSRKNKPTMDIYDLLRRAVNERRRIEVLTRDCRGIYGILIGWLIVFDKHMNLIMSDVDEVFRRLTDGHDYLELGTKKENLPVAKPTTSNSKAPEVPDDFQTFRAQLANFLRNKKKPSTATKAPRQALPVNDDEEIENECYQPPCECHPEQFLSMELLTVNNLIVQRLSGKSPHVDSSSVQLSTPLITSNRAKVRFFSRHIPKLYVKGDQICLIRLLSS
ncbi:unnamed protein product [Adineta ricciae]|uniref:LSM domain-containing protein n=1 Tax=Adineta ricciae TaxID=249248 RepID=A0A816GDY8_ADIRI|nr:unnamed protein product [Adineta ricciae]